MWLSEWETSRGCSKPQEEPDFEASTAILQPWSRDGWECETPGTHRGCSPASSVSAGTVGWGYETREEEAALRRARQERKDAEKKHWKFIRITKDLEKSERSLEKWAAIDNPNRLQKLLCQHARKRVEEYRRQRDALIVGLD